MHITAVFVVVTMFKFKQIIWIGPLCAPNSDGALSGEGSAHVSGTWGDTPPADGCPLNMTCFSQACSTRACYYPGSRQKYDSYLKHYPEAQLLGAEGAGKGCDSAVRPNAFQ